MTLGDTDLIPLIRSCAYDMPHVTEEDIRLLAYRLAHSPLQFDPTPRRNPLLDVRHEQDGSWSVSVRAMPGHVGCADTLEQAYVEAHDAALAWVEAATAPGAVDAGRLAAAINDAQVRPSELQLGHDLMPVAERIASKYEKSFTPAPPDDLFAASNALKRMGRRNSTLRDAHDFLGGEPFDEYARRAIADRDRMDLALWKAARDALVCMEESWPDRPATISLRAALAGEPEAAAEMCPHCDPRHEWPCPTIPRCWVDGCGREATCGFPCKEHRYHQSCGAHFERCQS